MVYKRLFLTMATATAMLAVLPMAAASAATPHVLTTGKTGGPAVAVGAILKAPLKTGTKASFFSPGTTTGVTCAKASVTDKVTKNPLKPGTATESLTAQTFGSCTTNIPGATSVQSVKVLNLPYATTISDATGFPIAVSKASTKLALNTVLGLVTCTYSLATVKGNASNTGSVNAFKNQVFKLSSGPAACPAQGSFSATFGPLKDTSVTGSPSVFVN
jgi:hypothetical protein